MTPPKGRKWRGTKEPPDKDEREKWKRWLKTQHSKNKDHGIQSLHFMQIDGETTETVTDFIFLGSKITADGDCSHKMKRCFLLGRKAMPNLDSILKSRDFTNKYPSSQSCGFSSSHVWMWELDWRKLSTEESMLLKNGVWEDSWESLELQGDPTSPSWGKSVLNIHWKNWCWSWNSNTLANWC